MIDHISIAVSDLDQSASFYEHVLEPLGLRRLVSREATVGFGKTYPEFWLNSRPKLQPVERTTGNHVCLRAPTEDAVIAFYRTALEIGGSDGGAPKDRQGAMTMYFAAFIHDPDGNKVEAVTFPQNDAR